MFKIGDYVVCPGHGVAQIADIEERSVGSEKRSFYICKIISNDMRIMVPIDTDSGIRELVTEDKILEVFDLLNNHDVQVDKSTWNRRSRDYLEKIKTGSLLEIADVVRALFLLKSEKSLSFGEKKMLEQSKSFLVEEISLTKGSNKNEVDSEIKSCFS